MKVAKERQDSGNEKQLAAIKQAAEEGARAGAVPCNAGLCDAACDAAALYNAEPCEGLHCTVPVPAAQGLALWEKETVRDNEHM